MDLDTVIGCLLVAFSLGFLTALVFVSRRRIDRIARNGYGSARHIIKEFNGDR